MYKVNFYDPNNQYLGHLSFKNKSEFLNWLQNPQWISLKATRVKIDAPDDMGHDGVQITRQVVIDPSFEKRVRNLLMLLDNQAATKFLQDELAEADDPQIIQLYNQLLKELNSEPILQSWHPHTAHSWNQMKS